MSTRVNAQTRRSIPLRSPTSSICNPNYGETTLLTNRYNAPRSLLSRVRLEDATEGSTIAAWWTASSSASRLPPPNLTLVGLSFGNPRARFAGSKDLQAQVKKGAVQRRLSPCRRHNRWLVIDTHATSLNRRQRRVARFAASDLHGESVLLSLREMVRCDRRKRGQTGEAYRLGLGASQIQRQRYPRERRLEDASQWHCRLSSSSALHEGPVARGETTL